MSMLSDQGTCLVVGEPRVSRVVDIIFSLAKVIQLVNICMPLEVVDLLMSWIAAFVALSVLKNRQSCIKTLAGHRLDAMQIFVQSSEKRQKRYFQNLVSSHCHHCMVQKLLRRFFFMTSKAKLCKMGFVNCKTETWHQPPVDYLLEHVVNLCEVEEVFPHFFNLFWRSRPWRARRSHST